MIFAAPAIILPPERPAIVRASDLKGLPSWQEMQRRERAIKEGSFPFPMFCPKTTVPIGAPSTLGSTVANSNAGTTTITTTAAIVAGNLVFVAIAVDDTAAADTVSSVSDGTNTYTKATNQNSSGGDQGAELWYVANAAAVGSSATITITWTGAISFGVAVAAAQCTGIIASSSLDKTALGPGTAITNPSATTATLSQANEIAIGVFSVLTDTITSDAGYTDIYKIANANGFAKLNLAYKIVAATTAVTFAPTKSSTNFEALLVATFKGN